MPRDDRARTIRLPSELNAEVEALADRDWVSVNSIIIKAVEQYLQNGQDFPGVIQSGVIKNESHTGREVKKESAQKESPYIDAPAGPRDSDSGSLSDSPRKPDPDRPDPKPMPLWKTKIQDPRAQAFIELGIGAWTGPEVLTWFDDLELSRILYAAWSANPDCDPVDVVGETLTQAEAWLGGKRKRLTHGRIKTYLLRRIRQDAANAKERTAKQQARIEQAIKAGEQVRADRDDDPLLAQEERKARGEI